MDEYEYVGHFYRGHIVWEGKVVVDAFFLVVDEYPRPSEVYPAQKVIHCMLMDISSGTMHEVHSSRLRHSSHYKRLA